MNAEGLDVLQRGGEDEPGAREAWRTHEAPEWAVPIEELERLKALLSSRIKPPALGPDGEALPSSKISRAHQAVAAARATGEAVLTYGELRKQQRRDPSAWSQAELAAHNAAAAERFHSDTPRALAAMGLGERAISQMAEVEETDPVRWVRTWLGTGKRWAFILSGIGGSGKTVALGYALYLHARETVRTTVGHVEEQWRPSRARYVLTSDLVTGVAFGREGEERVRKLIAVPLLALDDLGAEQLNDVGRDLLWRILDGRYRNEAKTLIATNLEFSDLVKIYGSRFERRLNPGPEGNTALRRLRTPYQPAEVHGG